MKQFVVRLLCGALTWLMVSAPVPAADVEAPEPLRYNDTQTVHVALSIVDGIATCSGRFLPGDCGGSLMITLYQQKEEMWVPVQAWSDSGTDGQRISIRKTRVVEMGTYKLVGLARANGKTLRVESGAKTY